MTVAKLLQTIKSLPQESQQKLTELYQVIDVLYKKYGSKLSTQPTMKAIAAESQDLADLISKTKETIGLEAVHELCAHLEKQAHIVTIQAPQGVSDRLAAKLGNASIQYQTTQELGIKVQSSQGQGYARSFDKDINKLTR